MTVTGAPLLCRKLYFVLNKINNFAETANQLCSLEYFIIALHLFLPLKLYIYFRLPFSWRVLSQIPVILFSCRMPTRLEQKSRRTTWLNFSCEIQVQRSCSPTGKCDESCANPLQRRMH